MSKRIQNWVAESRHTLPVAALYGVAIWFLSGPLYMERWFQLICFAISVWLVIRMNNDNLLIRIYSRMVSVSFIFLMCIDHHLFQSVPGSIAQLCFLISLVLLFQTYQDNTAKGKIFYVFLSLGVGSIAYIQMFYIIPLFWVLMYLTIHSLSWRTLTTSVTGLVCPYWLLVGWIVQFEHADFNPWIQKFQELGQFQMPFDFSTVEQSQILFFVFLVILGIIGTVQFMHKSYNDKIQVRQLYYSFILLGMVTAVFLAFQPQLYDLLIRILVVTVSPLIAHFLALTHNRISNIVFFIITGAVVLFTAYNLWSSSLIF